MRADPNRFDLSEFLPTSTENLGELYERLLAKVDSVREPHLRQLYVSLFRDPEFQPRFRHAPAGKGWHHAYVGGLLDDYSRYLINYRVVRDMTGPTENPEDKKIAPRTGGSEAFRKFIRTELMPAVAARYRVTGETAIVGESLAGLFVVETLFLEPDLFDTYIALDPSLWWNNEALVAGAEARLRARPNGRTARRRLAFHAGRSRCFSQRSDEPQLVGARQRRIGNTHRRLDRRAAARRSSEACTAGQRSPDSRPRHARQLWGFDCAQFQERDAVQIQHADLLLAASADGVRLAEAEE